MCSPPLTSPIMDATVDSPITSTSHITSHTSDEARMIDNNTNTNKNNQTTTTTTTTTTTSCETSSCKSYHSKCQGVTASTSTFNASSTLTSTSDPTSTSVSHPSPSPTVAMHDVDSPTSDTSSSSSTSSPSSTLSISPTATLDPSNSPLLAPFLTSLTHTSAPPIPFHHYDTPAAGVLHVTPAPVLAMDDIDMSHHSDEDVDVDTESSEDGMTTSTSSIDEKEGQISRSDDDTSHDDIPADWCPPSYEEWFTSQPEQTLSPPQRALTLSHLTRDIATREDDLRQQLSTYHSARDDVLHRLVTFRDTITARREYTTRSSRAMESHATTTSRHLKHIDMTRDRQLRTIRGVEETRRKMVSNIKGELKWDRAHHYHLTALDHYMGHPQPSLMEIGCMIRGHLRVCAVANQLIARQRKMTAAVVEANAERERESKKLAEYEKSIQHHQRESHELTRLADVLTHRYGAECDRYQQRYQKEKKAVSVTENDAISTSSSTSTSTSTPITSTPTTSTPTSPTNLSESMAALSIPTTEPLRNSSSSTSQPTPSRNATGYLDIKKRYFQSLNVNQHSTSPTSSSPLHDTSSSDTTVTSTTNASISSSSPTTSTPASDPSTSPSISTSASSASTSTSPTTDTTSSASSSFPGSLFPSYWSDLQHLVSELHTCQQHSQHAWEQLEMVLDRRERLKWDMREDVEENHKGKENEESNKQISPSLSAASPSKSRFSWFRMPSFRKSRASLTNVTLPS